MDKRAANTAFSHKKVRTVTSIRFVSKLRFLFGGGEGRLRAYARSHALHQPKIHRASARIFGVSWIEPGILTANTFYQMQKGRPVGGLLHLNCFDNHDTVSNSFIWFHSKNETIKREVKLSFGAETMLICLSNWNLSLITVLQFFSSYG